MGKFLKSNPKSSTSPSALPSTPFIYINDPLPSGPHSSSLAALIPICTTSSLSSSPADKLITFLTTPTVTPKDSVPLITDHLTDDETAIKLTNATQFRNAAIKYGRNFVSVNLFTVKGSSSADVKAWGTNHLELCIKDLTTNQVAEKVYKWLFTPLSIPEHLHLLPASAMTAIDTKHFPTYAYCPISESRTRPRDDKIQFVALVLTKPVVQPGLERKLSWSVIDRTGIANFYFYHRGPASQYTWDWVLSLQPGDRKALPRMPCVRVTESVPLRVLKAPVRGVAAAIGLTGRGIRGVGHGIARVGQGLGRGVGRGAEWVPEADVVFRNGKAVDGRKLKNKGEGKVEAEKAEVVKEGKREIVVFDEKGRKLWGDEDSVAETEADSLSLKAEAQEEKEFF